MSRNRKSQPKAPVPSSVRNARYALSSAVAVAVIALISAVAVALINNYDKVFPRSTATATLAPFTPEPATGGEPSSAGANPSGGMTAPAILGTPFPISETQKVTVNNPSQIMLIALVKDQATNTAIMEIEVPPNTWQVIEMPIGNYFIEITRIYAAYTPSGTGGYPANIKSVPVTIAETYCGVTILLDINDPLKIKSVIINECTPN